MKELRCHLCVSAAFPAATGRLGNIDASEYVCEENSIKRGRNGALQRDARENRHGGIYLNGIRVICAKYQHIAPIPSAFPPKHLAFSGHHRFGRSK
jgi:hypothetical protein